MKTPNIVYLQEGILGLRGTFLTESKSDSGYVKKYYSEDLIEEIIKQLKTRKKEVNETVGFGIEEALWVIEEVLKDE